MQSASLQISPCQHFLRCFRSVMFDQIMHIHMMPEKEFFLIDTKVWGMKETHWYSCLPIQLNTISIISQSTLPVRLSDICTPPPPPPFHYLTSCDHDLPDDRFSLFTLSKVHKRSPSFSCQRDCLLVPGAVLGAVRVSWWLKPLTLTNADPLWMRTLKLWELAKAVIKLSYANKRCQRSRGGADEGGWGGGHIYYWLVAEVKCLFFFLEVH